jgi:energy-coupling factor transport system substrate-specific component
MALGQGMWTPWQMYAWGLIGYLAGVFFAGTAEAEGFEKRSTRVIVYIYGAAASAAFSVIMDTWFITGFLTGLSQESAAAAYGAGIALNIGHITVTVIFLLFMLKPWGKRIRRIKRKYLRGTED